MAETQESGHIKVNAHEDEVVIYAGEHASVPPASSEAGRPAPTRVRAEGSAQDVSQRADEERQAGARKDPYHATTLEDISSFRMSTAQKAVIIVAVLALVAFIVWYAAFSG